MTLRVSHVLPASSPPYRCLYPQRSPMAAALAQAQHTYVAAFGFSGQEPLPLPEQKKKDAKAAKA